MPNKKKDLIKLTLQNASEYEFIKSELWKNVVRLRKLGITPIEITDNDLDGIFFSFSE